MKATIKPGDKLWSPETGPCVAIPSSPGSLPAADEEAIGQLRFGIADGLWAMKINEGTEKAVFLKKRLEAALSHLHSRLARLADAEREICDLRAYKDSADALMDVMAKSCRESAALHYHEEVQCREKVKEGKHD